MQMRSISADAGEQEC